MRRPLLFAVAIALAACSGGGPQTEHPPPPAATDEAPAAAPRRDSEIEKLADDLMARAARNEPDVSRMLQEVATKVAGSLAGFEHRLKQRDSTIRKIRSILHKDPSLQVSSVVIDDALRYTLVVSDAPAGRHAEAIRACFAALEAAGHRVKKVKNYWPRGDNYSGVNSVLVAPDGLEWELQFHTPDSFEVKERTHALYEEMREDDTPVAEKRKLYHQLAAPWEKVAIPKDMLTPKALHGAEEIILRPPP